MFFFHRAAAVNADSVSWVSWMSWMSWMSCMSCNCSAGRFCVLWSPNDRCRIVSFIKIQTAPASSAQLHHRSWTCRTCRTLCGPQLGRKMLLSKGLNCQPRSGQPFDLALGPISTPSPFPAALPCFIVCHWCQLPSKTTTCWKSKSKSKRSECCKMQ